MSQNRTIRSTARSLAVAISLGALLPAIPASAQEFVLQTELGAAFWLTEPQSERFTPGLYLAVRPGISLSPLVSLQWSYAMLHTPAADGFTDDGSAHFLTGGVRLRPLGLAGDPADHLGGLWIDGNLGYVSTGDLDRFGFDAGLGYGFQPAPWLALGPFVRYGHIVQPDDHPRFDGEDGQFLTAGLSASFGPAYEEEEVAPAPEPCPEAPECVQIPAQPCADGDGDGVCDDADRCPSIAGPKATYGCPTDPCTGAPLIVLVQFEYNSAELPPPQENNPQTMDPVLEAVASAIAQNPSCRVCIVGYASEEGDPERNKTLSRSRASAVQGYLAARGADRSRMPTTGFGASCQMVPENTRTLNRRVEFRRLEAGQSCPVDCDE